jgi:uncharacterized protein (DUF952 family)
VSLIVHIVDEDSWTDSDGAYRADSLETEGFIHCSDPGQVVAVAEANYGGRDDLLLVCIDEDRVDPPVRREALDAAEPYPHVYGPLNPGAVVDVVAFPRDEDGFFVPDRVWELR